MTSRMTASREPHPKKRKIAIACEQCRTRKARCDGEKPVCGGCSGRAQQCIYKISATDATFTTEYVESLVNRITQLEQEVNALQSIRSTAPNNSDSAMLIDPNHSRDAFITPAQGMLPSTCSPVDAMGGNAGTGDPASVSNKFYGSSSALSFTRQVYSNILRKDAVPAHTVDPSPSHWSPTVASATAMCCNVPENFSLLPRHLTDYLMSLYWDRVHVLYPFLHKPSFSRAYEDLWKPSTDHGIRNKSGLGVGASNDSGPLSVVFHCAFNVALALGIQFSTLRVEEKERLSSSCLEKSKKLLDLDLFDEGNISLIQTLLLLTQFFQSTTYPTKCWTSIGVACRLAQGLGLHVEEDRFQQHLDTDEREIRRRVWHGCVIMDIAVSMTLGRPTMLIGDAGRSLPGPVDDNDDWVLICGTTPRKASVIALFSETVKLYRIVERILSNVYKLNEQRREEPELSDGCTQFDVLVEIDQELSHFAHQLPATLSWSQTGSRPSLDQNGLLLQQSHVLHVRFLHARVLLYRSVFFKYCQSNSSAGSRPSSPAGMLTSTVATPFTFHSALTCVKTAMTLISTIKGYSATEATGAWWYNMFYTRTAAVVVLLAAVCPALHDSIGNDAWMSAWADCQTILVHNLPQVSIVRICSRTLEALHCHIMRHVALSEPDPEPDHSIDHAGSLRTESNQASHFRLPHDIEPESVDHMGDQSRLHSAYGCFDFLEAGMYSDLMFDPMHPFQ